MRLTTILLIRHATTAYVGKALAGRTPSVGLNEQGDREAADLARRLASQPIDALYSSPLDRAQQTAEYLAREHGLSIAIDERLAEVDFGDWTGQTIADLDEREDWKLFNLFRSTWTIPNGESMLQVQQRMVRAIEDLYKRHEGGTVAVVSHADAIKSALTHFLGMPIDFFLRLEISPASVSTVRLYHWGCQVLRINA